MENTVGKDAADIALAKRLFYIACGCSSYDSHGGFNRGLIDFTENKETMNKCHIVLESLRNGYDILVKHANRWVQCMLDYEDWDAPLPSELRSMCLGHAWSWAFAGMPPPNR